MADGEAITEPTAKDMMVAEGCHVYGVKDDSWDGFIEESTGLCAQDTAMNWAVDRIRNHDVHDCDPEGCDHMVDCTKPLDATSRAFIIVDEVVFHLDTDDIIDCDFTPGECPGGEGCIC
jgi:hypothetical protein